MAYTRMLAGLLLLFAPGTWAQAEVREPLAGLRAELNNLELAKVYVQPVNGGDGGELELIFEGAAYKTSPAEMTWALIPVDFIAAPVGGGWSLTPMKEVVFRLKLGPGAVASRSFQLAILPLGEASASAASASSPSERISIRKWKALPFTQVRAFPGISKVKNGDARSVGFEVPLPANLWPLVRLSGASCGGPEKITCNVTVKPGTQPNAIQVDLEVPGAKSAIVEITLKIPLDDGSTPQPELTLTLHKDECEYQLVQATPLFEGFHEPHLYLRASVQKNPGRCMPWAAWSSSIRVTAEGHEEDIEVRWETAPSGADDGILALTLSSLPRDIGGRLALRFFYARDPDSKVRLEGSEDGILELRISRAPTITDAQRIEVRHRTSDVARAREEMELLALEGPPTLAVNRHNFLAFEAAKIEDWRMRLTSFHVRPCDGWAAGGDAEAGPPPLKLLAPREGFFCVEPVRDTSDPLRMDLFYRPKWSELDPPYTGPEKIRLNLGHLPLETRLASKSQRLALNLQERTTVRCENTRAGSVERLAAKLSEKLRPDPVVVSSYTGPRAVPAEDLDHCKVVIDLLRGGPQLRERRWAEENLPQQRTEESLREEALAFLDYVGEQSLRISAELPPESQEQQPTSLFTKVVKLKADSDLLIRNGAAEIPIRIHRGNNVQLKDYSVIAIEVAHAPGAQYAPGDESFPTSEMEADLRLMPPYLAGRLVRGVGPRLFVTIEIPTGLLRYPGSGDSAVTSTAYRKVEAAVFGIGTLAVLEIFDFDNAKPFLSFNPQLHAGILLSSIPQAGLIPPRLSYILGAAVRFPAGVKLPTAVESGLATVLWIEFSERARGDWHPALLFGFSVNVGSFPN